MFNKLKNLINTDSTHTKASLHLTLFVFGGIDINSQMLCLTMEMYYDNESDNT